MKLYLDAVPYSEYEKPCVLLGGLLKEKPQTSRNKYLIETNQLNIDLELRE